MQGRGAPSERPRVTGCKVGDGARWDGPHSSSSPYTRLGNSPGARNHARAYRCVEPWGGLPIQQGLGPSSRHCQHDKQPKVPPDPGHHPCLLCAPQSPVGLTAWLQSPHRSRQHHAEAARAPPPPREGRCRNAQHSRACPPPWPGTPHHQERLQLTLGWARWRNP